MVNSGCQCTELVQASLVRLRTEDETQIYVVLLFLYFPLPNTSTLFRSLARGLVRHFYAVSMGLYFLIC